MNLPLNKVLTSDKSSKAETSLKRDSSQLNASKYVSDNIELFERPFVLKEISNREEEIKQQ